MSDIYISEEVASVIDLYKEVNSALNVLQFLSEKAEILHHGHQTKHPGAVIEITCWHPGLIGKPARQIFDTPFSEDDAKLTISRIHGFLNWEEVINSNLYLNNRFELAVDNLLRGDINTLEHVLTESPEIVNLASNYPHHATLLHYCASNGLETERQVVPDNLLEIVELLIEKGADKKAKMKVYGGEHTPTELAATSSHPFKAGMSTQLIDKLK
ncbi:hypothetical protein [Marinoscillum pacificum]|uniref:hypothetical protein n=1 Tax=Marinoscillum pacificum TaxID=392723 RepID=UPI002157BF3D|nr:hypothetical protein [Marinoscillum pacificum]